VTRRPGSRPAPHGASGVPALEELAGHVPTPEVSLTRERGLTPLSVISQFASGLDDPNAIHTSSVDM